MILYGNSLSPYVRKVLAYSVEKGLKLELRQVGIGNVDPEFRAASPFGKMPGFRDGDFAISDSTAIVTYLEALHPQPALIPAEPRSRARTIWFDEFADTILVAAAGKIFFNRIVAPMIGREGDLAAAAAAERDEVPPVLDYLESVIPDSGFLVDDRLTLADLSVASPFANLAHCEFCLDAGRWPRVKAYAERILARPSFAPIVAGETAFLDGRKAA